MATFRFCTECNNMLYPKEDKINRTLLYACRNCDHQEDAELDQRCVYRHLIQHGAEEQVTAKTDLSTDPTYPRAKRPCPKCGYPEAVFFQSRAKRADTSMKLFFACASGSCNHRWVD